MNSTPDPMVVVTTGYQVWSTVLGSSLTTVDADGDKRETKVFAGGTLIAKQFANGTTTTSDDQITFTTADPVTGTKVTFAGGGTTTLLEEAEPLGQKIATIDLGVGYPSNYGEVRGVAREPEWQCMLPQEIYGGFMALPTHCKQAVIESGNFSLAKEFGYQREENPKKISGNDSPIPNIPGTGGDESPSDLVIAKASRSTHKPSVEGKKDYAHDGGDLGTVTIRDPGPDPLDAFSAEHGFELSWCGGPGQPPCPKEGIGKTPNGPDCSDQLLVPVVVRDDSADVPVVALFHKSIVNDLLAAFADINKVVPGGIGFTEGYRTYERQKQLYDAYVARGKTNPPAAKPGTSRHESGFAFDVKGMGTWGNSSALANQIIPIFAGHGFDWGDQFADQPHFQGDWSKGGYKSQAEAIKHVSEWYNLCIKGLNK